MNYKIKYIFFSVIIVLLCSYKALPSYPIDGYENTGIRRLLHLKMLVDEEIQGKKPIAGALKSITDTKLHLLGKRGDSLNVFPAPDERLQKSINAIFPNLHESYSVSVLDITPGKKIRYAQRHEKKQFQPGSVGKIAVAIGLFSELNKIYPDSFEKRKILLKTKLVRAGKWAMLDEHTVPFFDLETKKIIRRQVQENDVMSLYEWADHMLSASNNGAASVLWREVILMRVFGKEYLTLTEQQATDYFKNTPKSQLSDAAISVVNEPLRELNIMDDEWRLGTLFTRGASSIIPGKGGSTGSPLGLMKFLVALEKGKVVDPSSSLEIKRLLYATDKRIRYAASTALTNAAVYFKSGSLYGCKSEEGFVCKKYHGNIKNYMNSVAIIEHPDGTTYIVTLMSNVLRKNSANDHFALASQIDKIIKK